MGICRIPLPPPFKVAGMDCYSAFGTSYHLGMQTGIEGAWVAPLYTALFLMVLGAWTLFSPRNPGNGGPASFLRWILAFYAFVTAMVEVVRVVFDANRFAFVWAALHNLGEWGIIIHLFLGQQQVPKAWPWTMLWILFIIQNVLFQPSFKIAAISEQITGIWCDWLMVALMISRLRDSWHIPQLRKLFTYGTVATVLHMMQILPLVALLTGYVKAPSVALGTLIAFTFPIVFFCYILFANLWDRQTAIAAGEEVPDAENAAFIQEAAFEPLDLASQSPYLAERLPLRKICLIFGITALLGFGTIAVPRLVAPECPLASVGVPALPQVEPLCQAPLTVAGTTRVVAKPGKEGALADMLQTVPGPTRLEEGNLSFDLAFEPETRTFHIADSWTSLRTLNKRLASSPVDFRTFYSPEFKALVESTTVTGPFHPMVPCSVAAQQAKLQSMTFSTDLAAPLACVWAKLDDFANVGYIEGVLASHTVTPSLRSVTFPAHLAAGNCTILEARQRFPAVPEHTLRYHTISGCWTDAEHGGDVEVNIDTLAALPGASRGHTTLTLTLDVAAKRPGRSSGVYEVFFGAGQARLPFVKRYFEQACASSA